ncbi:MAG TPA: DUF4062 domain-containing protein [Pyrinomonadaceae bacterium]|nr:DUF4062 domain-containing protein [Pyrinomonadaceae bacterium]
MGTKIRVFIASTMKDLANERDAVVRRVRGFNFEPVNAEAWLPGGTRVWERIEKEIESCHLFILISGESYGWVPDEGPGAPDGLSVTHMEMRKARAEGLPILPFFKRLGYESTRDEGRDTLRREVASWAEGRVVAEFELASDLAEKVTSSLVEVISETYLTEAVRKRAELARAAEGEVRASGSEADAVGAEAVGVVIPPRLVAEVAGGGMIMIAGAGISLAAGYPSERAMTELVTAELRASLGDPDLDLTGRPFQETASNLEIAFGRERLLEIFRRAMSGPQGINPTLAHLLGVRLFDSIITTNYDTLFEEACTAQGIRHEVVEGDLKYDAGRGLCLALASAPDESDGGHPEDVRPPGGTVIYKLSGSLNRPESLRITERDVWEAFGDGPAIWQHLLAGVTGSRVLVVGSSLRHTALKMLFSDAGEGIRGYIVTPKVYPFDRHRYESLNLRPIEATADAFFRVLTDAVEKYRQARAE